MKPDDDLDRIEQLVGPLRGGQRDEILTALGDSREGVLRLAERIGRADNLDAPAAAFIASVRRGEQRLGTQRSPERDQRTATERARDLYRSKLRDVRLASDEAASIAARWSEREQRQYALDYALDWCGAHGPALWAIERELRAELDTERLDGPDDFERSTEWRQRMIDEHHA